MKIHKSIGAIIGVSFVAIIMTACGKEVTITPGKEITLSDEEKKEAEQMYDTFHNAYQNLMGRDEGGEGSTSFGNITVSISCPQGWKVDTESKEYLRAVHDSYPKYVLQVETDDILNRHYDDIANKYVKKIKQFSSRNIKKEGKAFKRDYEWNLKHRGYPNWETVQFGSKELNGQYYMTAKGKLKAASEKHVGRGIYRYITICNGKMLRFTFTAKDPKIDGSVTAIFDSIIKTAAYGKA